MLQRGYSKALASGTIAAGGTLGIIIPPSVVLILYGILTENSIITLFLASVIPGLIATALYALAVAVTVRLNPDAAPRLPKTPWSERLRTTRDCWAVLVLAIVVAVGIYSGIFTVPRRPRSGRPSPSPRPVAAPALADEFSHELEGHGVEHGPRVHHDHRGSIFGYFVSLSGLPEASSTPSRAWGLAPIAVIFLLPDHVPHRRRDLRRDRAHDPHPPLRLPAHHEHGLRPDLVGRHQRGDHRARHDHPADRHQRLRAPRHGQEPAAHDHLRGVTPFILVDIVRLALLTFLPVLTLWLPKATGWM
jgi:hypothetical protein